MRFAAFAILPALLIGSWIAPKQRPTEIEVQPSHWVDIKPDARRLPFRLMSPDADSEIRSMMPEILDEEIDAILDDPHTLFYTDREMPKVYQQWDGALPGVHSAHYNISADDFEPYGNGNLEYPWGTPAGTENSQHVTSVKFLSLPSNESGELEPVVWYRQRFRGDDRQGYAWIFPIGTVIGECLVMDGPTMNH